MTQRVFDVENEKDIADLWDILPDGVKRIYHVKGEINHLEFEDDEFNTILFKINWQDKTEITRPIKEATESDVGKICVFWDDNPDNVDNIGILACISDCYATSNGKVEFEKHRYQCGGISWKHCRRLNPKEIEEKC